MKALALVLGMAATTAAQSSGPAVAGTWTARFESRTIVRLELAETGGTVTGALGLGDIQVDKKGAVSKAAPAPRVLSPIFDVTLSGSTMTFSRKDGEDTDRFEVRFLDKDRAELHFLLSDTDRRELAAEGIPVPRPIALTRQ